MKALSKLAAPLSAIGLVLTLATVGLGDSTADPRAVAATEANITRLTAGVLERSQFAHHPLDGELAGKFLDRYLDALDGTRSLLTQADLDEFAAYRKSLPQATRGTGDTTPAHAIFARYLQRLEQRVDHATKLLRSEKFDFTGHDTFSFDRSKAERPRRSGGRAGALAAAGPLRVPAGEAGRQAARADRDHPDRGTTSSCAP